MKYNIPILLRIRRENEQPTQEQLELLQDIHTSVSQIKNGEGVSHEDAQKMILERISSIDC
jgi:hypothetical protein